MPGINPPTVTGKHTWVGKLEGSALRTPRVWGAGSRESSGDARAPKSRLRTGRARRRCICGSRSSSHTKVIRKSWRTRRLFLIVPLAVIQGRILKIPYEQGSEHVFSGVGVHMTRASAAIPYEITMKSDRVSARRSHQDTVNAVLHDQSTGEVH